MGLYEKESLHLDFYQSDIEATSKRSIQFGHLRTSVLRLSLLNVISFLDPDQISEEILKNIAELERVEQLPGYPLDVSAVHRSTH